MSFGGWRKLIAGTAITVLGISAFHAIRWVHRDITYWSRSVTVPYKTESLEECVRLSLPDWPDVSAAFSGQSITLSTPHLEGLLVKEAEASHLARIVAYGHSASVSKLGPASEDAVQRYLNQLSRAMTTRCSGE